MRALGLKASDLFADSRRREGRKRGRPRPVANTPNDPKWTELAQRFQHNATDAVIGELGRQLGVSTESLVQLGVGWAERTELARFTRNRKGRAGAWTFPMRDENRSICGICVRHPNGDKWTLRGGKLGLFVPRDLDARDGDVLVPEGASDVAAAWDLGFPAVGRASARHGAKLLAGLFPSRTLIIVGENDRKPDGSWPGREGAQAVARDVHRATGRMPRVLLPPPGCKDLRDRLAREREGGGP